MSLESLQPRLKRIRKDIIEKLYYYRPAGEIINPNLKEGEIVKVLEYPTTEMVKVTKADYNRDEEAKNITHVWVKDLVQITDTDGVNFVKSYYFSRRD